MNKSISLIENLIIVKHSIQNLGLKVRVVNKSQKIPAKLGASKFEFFYMDLMDDGSNDHVRRLFYVGHATKSQMNGFYTNVKIDDIILLTGFMVEKSDRGSLSINNRIKLRFDRIEYEKLSIQPQIQPLMISNKYF